MLALLRKQKVQMALIALIVEVIIALVPQLESGREFLMVAVASIFIGLMGMHTATDIAAIKSDK